MKNKIPYSKIFCLLILIGFMLSCSETNFRYKETEKDLIQSTDIFEIVRNGKLTALVDNSSTSFIIYKGQPMGFEYEMLVKFCDYIGVKLEIKVVRNMDSIMEFLKTGKGDVIAANYTITRERQNSVAFSEPLLVTRQVLVQRKPMGWEQMTKSAMEKELIRKQIDLAGKEIYVRKNSSFYSRLKALSDEIGSPLNIREAPGDYETELLIKMVASGEINYTVADENVAMVNATYYPQLDVETAVSFQQKIGWAFRKSSPKLLELLNYWLGKEKEKAEFAKLCNKYFRSPKDILERRESPYFSYPVGLISKYDHIARIYSKTLRWDWRLLVSLMYQESRFDPDAKSWAGAFGIMQLMPGTAAMFGVDTFSTAAQHVAAGTKYLFWLDGFWKQFISDSTERLKFVLASYNVGLGHIIDARNLAIKQNLNTDVWDSNVAQCILLKSDPRFYNDPVVKYGYCRGEEPYNYVKEILSRYEHYCQIMGIRQISQNWKAGDPQR